MDAMEALETFDIDDQAPSLDFLKEPEAVTARERDVIACIANGMRNVEVAQTLAISPHTVRHHITHIRRKLGIHRRRELIEWAMRTQVLPHAPCPAG